MATRAPLLKAGMPVTAEAARLERRAWSAARSALEAAYRGGKLNQAAFKAAVQRIIALRTSLRR